MGVPGPGRPDNTANGASRCNHRPVGATPPPQAGTTRRHDKDDARESNRHKTRLRLAEDSTLLDRKGKIRDDASRPAVEEATSCPAPHRTPARATWSSSPKKRGASSSTR